MKAEKDNLEEYGKRVLSPLRDVPSMEADAVAEERKKFLLQGEIFRATVSERTPPLTRNDPAFGRRRLSLMKVLVGALIALIILTGGGTVTVFASQNSLPGEPLYFVKSLSEDIRLSFSTSPQEKLDLTLIYTDRRVGEIQSLVNSGKELPPQTSDRLKGELDNALNLASTMDDGQMMHALGQIENTAASQGITLEELINKMPDQANPAVVHIQERLQEQIELSNLGLEDPEYFRTQVNSRFHRNLWGNPHLTKTTTPGSPSGDGTVTPTKPGKGNQGNNGNQNPPGQNGQGNPTPGNPNHQPNP